MKLGIIGQGYVGKAVKTTFEDYYEVLTYDISPEISNTSNLLELVEKTDLVFICVPTPMKKDGSCDISIVDKILEEINTYKEIRTILFAIKSTVLPGSTDKFISKYRNLNIVFNPEFLTEANFLEDFKNQDRIIIGGSDQKNIIYDLYKKVFPNAKIVTTDPKVAEMVKYLTNTFLATKVSFANEMRIICKSLNIRYEDVIKYALLDKRLGTSHWSVPGPDGKLGFGGSCFPKDINALNQLCKELALNVNVIPSVIKTNLEVRPEKDWENLKGRAVVDDE